MHIQHNPSTIGFSDRDDIHPSEVRNEVFGQMLFYCYFHFYVLAIVFLEANSFFAIMLREVTDASAVCFCGFTGNAEISDKILAFLQFLILELKDSSDSFQ